MDEYITKARALQIVKGLIGVTPNMALFEVSCQIRNTKPADVEPVVRCMECQQYYFADNRVPAEQTWMCALHGIPVKPSDYCSRATRKSEE